MGFERVYLVRHTAPAIEVGRCYGAADVPLDELIFATELPEIVRHLPADGLLITSPLTRCRRLADAIATLHGHANMQIEHDLRERSLGDWEGKRWDDIAHSQINDWRDHFVDYAPPGGESVRALQTRVTSLWQRVSATQNPSLVIVAHAGPLAVLRALMMNQTLDANSLQSAPPCGSICEIKLRPATSAIRLR